MKKILIITAVACVLALAAVGVSMVGGAFGTGNNGNSLVLTSTAETKTGTALSASASVSTLNSASTSILSSTDGSALDVTGMFTERDLEQTANVDEASAIELVSGEDVEIDEEGVYVIRGDASEVTITVNAAEDAKVQLVLDGVSITNTNAPAIYVVSADKVFITLTDSKNKLEVSGSYETASLDSVIISKSDLTLNGTGTLEIVSAKGNGITSKDDLKITGGTYTITAAVDGLKANDSIRIYDGSFTITANKDALHSENNKDSSLGYIYIRYAALDISAADDGIQGNAIVQIDGGAITINTSAEGIEGTWVQINGGEISIYATDDGINAAQKSAYDMLMEINGGTITIKMASGDTDALDSNGSLYINGGSLNITANSAFDYNATGVLNGGTVVVNGQTVTQLTQSQMGGGNRTGGHGGKPSR